MIKVKLLGEAGQRFIEEFEADISSVSDLISCLQSNFSDFTSYLADAAQRGIGFHIRVGYQDIEDESQLSKSFSSKVKSLTLTPIPVGSGGGLGKILLGVALIGAGLLTGGAGFLGISSMTLLLTGGSLLLGGIAELFGKTKSPNDEKDGKRSLVFGGGAQTVQEGSRIPLVYGRKHRVGIFVLSARVTTYAA